MRKFFSDKLQIKYIRKALKNPHLYNDEELIKLKTSLQKLYDENYDNCQEQEDDWVSSVIGTESDAVYDVLSNL